MTPPRLTSEAVKARRQELGYSIRGFARALGVANSTVQAWESGASPVPRWLPLAIKGLGRKKS